MDGVGAEGAVDKPPGMQVSQGVRNLEQQMHDHLHVQHGELGALESRDKTARTETGPWTLQNALQFPKPFQLILRAT